MRTDVGVLLPMGMLVADMVPDNPGTWFFHCHVANHLRMGMQATYTVERLRPAASGVGHPPKPAEHVQIRNGDCRNPGIGPTSREHSRAEVPFLTSPSRGGMAEPFSMADGVPFGTDDFAENPSRVVRRS